MKKNDILTDNSSYMQDQNHLLVEDSTRQYMIMVRDSQETLQNTLEEYFRTYTKLLFENLGAWANKKGSQTRGSSQNRKHRSNPTQDILQEVFPKLPNIEFEYIPSRLPPRKLNTGQDKRNRKD